MTKVWKCLVVGACVVTAGIVYSCGSNKDDDKDSGSGTKYTWASDIAPIVAADCSAVGCHGTASPLSTVYESNETNFMAAKTLVINRLSKKPGTDGFMPKGVASYDTSRMQKMIDFLSQ